MRTPIVSGIVIAALCLFSGTQVSLADSSSGSSVGSGMPSPDRIPKDKQTDLVPGKTGVPDEYATTPVRQGSLKEVTDNKWLNQKVTNQQGEELGKVTKILRDEKTKSIEYAFLEVTGTHHAMPMRWSRFQEKGDKLILNAKKDDLLPSINRSDTKDVSPDLAQFMSEIEQKRSEPKPHTGMADGRGNERPVPSAGEMGEDKSAQNLGPRGAPAQPAPQFEGEAHKKKE